MPTHHNQHNNKQSLAEKKASSAYYLDSMQDFTANPSSSITADSLEPMAAATRRKKVISSSSSTTNSSNSSRRRIAVVGSREFKSLDLISQWLDFANDKWDGNIVLVSGGCRGVDKTAEQWAIDRKINRDIFLPNWNQQGKKAGILRNKQIVENADFIIAFWDEESSGTEFTLNYAKKLGKPCIIVFEDGFHKKW